MDLAIKVAKELVCLLHGKLITTKEGMICLEGDLEQGLQVVVLGVKLVIATKTSKKTLAKRTWSTKRSLRRML